MVTTFSQVNSRPNERWAQATPERQEFFKKAERPDNPPHQGHSISSCCDQADAYEADEFDTDNEGNLYAILTCNDPENCSPVCDEEYSCRAELPVGTRIKIPPQKILRPHEPDNYTGHGWVFLGGMSVLCYAFPAGL